MSTKAKSEEPSKQKAKTTKKVGNKANKVVQKRMLK